VLYQNNRRPQSFGNFYITNQILIFVLIFLDNISLLIINIKIYYLFKFYFSIIDINNIISFKILVWLRNF
jgi:hypothetical protein